MWQTRLNKSSRYGSGITMKSLQYYTTNLRTARVASMEPIDLESLRLPDDHGAFPTIDDIVVQSGDVVLLLAQTDAVVCLVTVGNESNHPIYVVPVRTLVLVQEGTVYGRSMFVRGDGEGMVRVSSGDSSSTANGTMPSEVGTGISLISNRNFLRLIRAQNDSLLVQVSDDGRAVELAPAVRSTATIPTVDNTWTMQYEAAMKQLTVRMKLGGALETLRLSHSMRGAIVPFGWNDVEWTIGQIDIIKDECRLITGDLGSYIPVIAYGASVTTPHVGEALVSVRGWPSNAQSIGVSLRLTIQTSTLSTPAMFWVGIDCLDVNGELHTTQWPTGGTGSTPTQANSHFRGLLTVPVGTGLKSVTITNWQAQSTTPLVTGPDGLSYPSFVSDTGCQVVVLRMGMTAALDNPVYIVGGQFELVSPVV
jgi:hypothetical protein